MQADLAGIFDDVYDEGPGNWCPRDSNLGNSVDSLAICSKFKSSNFRTALSGVFGWMDISAKQFYDC